MHEFHYETTILKDVFGYFRQFNVNVKAIINVSQVVAKKMINNKSGGSIVNVSSQVIFIS